MLSISRRIYWLLTLVIALAFAACTGTTQRSVVKDPEPVKKASPLPAIQLTDLDVPMMNNIGDISNAKLSSLTGTGNVVVIDIWATWCGPCRQSIPDLIKVQNEYKSKGLKVIGLTTEEPQEAKDLVKDFVKQNNMDYQIGFATRELAQALKFSNSIPQCYVFGKDGKLVDKLVGFHPVRTPVRLRDSINKALNM